MQGCPPCAAMGCDVPSITAISCPFSFFRPRIKLIMRMTDNPIRLIRRIRGFIIIVDFRCYIRQQTTTNAYSRQQTFNQRLSLDKCCTFASKTKNIHTMNDLSIPTSQSGEIVLYQPDENVSLEVKLMSDTVWLSIDQMAQLFGRDRSVIGKHVRSVFSEGELTKESVWANFAYTAADGKTYMVDFYNLDMIISVGYRVKSKQGIVFRQWANGVLKEYLLRGYSINQQLLAMQRQVDLLLTSTLVL